MKQRGKRCVSSKRMDKMGDRIKEQDTQRKSKPRKGATRELDTKNCNKKNKSAKKNIKYHTGINHKSSLYGFRLREGNVENIDEMAE